MKIQLIDSLLKQPQGKSFLILNDKNISYKDILTLISKFVEFLSKIEKQYIFIIAEKNEYTIALYLACSKLGKIACFIDPLSKSPDKFVKLSEDDGFLFSKKYYKEIERLSYNLIDTSEQINHNEMSEVIFTTGTTGDPKGVLLSHLTVTETAKNINKFTKIKSSDIEMHMMPISHSFGLARLRCCILRGCTLIFHDGFGNLINFFNSLDKHKGTVISTVPAGILFLTKLAKEKLKNYKSQINIIELGSSPMITESKIELTQLLPNTNICMHYGLTEASRSTFLNFKKDYKFISSVGKANKGTKILIIDKNDNKCSNNHNGEICIKGTNLFSGYAFTKIKPKYHKEYFKTGDYGYLDDNGYLFFEARKDDMINISGKKVSPIEIEKYINQVPFIDDVACIQAENKRTGLIEIKAFVVLNDKKIVDSWSSEIKKYLRNKIEYYKIPATIVNINSIPKSHNGKILRMQLKEDNQC
jgi:long-chain acyl-CoA synthetase